MRFCIAEMPRFMVPRYVRAVAALPKTPSQRIEKYRLREQGVTGDTFDREAAEDLTQNVFLRMIRYRSSYRENQKFQSWIFQVARNVFSDHYQATRHERSASMDIEKLTDHLADENAARLEEIEGVEHVYPAELEGVGFDTANLPTDSELRLREGAQVLFVKNDSQ